MKFSTLTTSLVFAIQVMRSNQKYFCDFTNPNCPKGQVCVKRYVLDVSNPFDSDYKNALQDDPDLYKGSETTYCNDLKYNRDLIYFSGMKDKDTGVTLTYTIYGE